MLAARRASSGEGETGDESRDVEVMATGVAVDLAVILELLLLRCSIGGEVILVSRANGVMCVS